MPQVTVDSYDIHFDDIAGPTPDAPTVLWGHGFLLSAALYRDLIDLLPEYRHVISDLRGHGRCSAITTEGTVQRMADDLWAVAQSLGLDTFYYIGHSMGASIGWRLAASHTDAIRAGVSIGGIPVTGKLPEAREWVHSMIEMTGKQDELIDMIGGLYKHLPATHPAVKAAGAEGARVPREIISEIVLHQFHLDESERLLPALTQPWLFVASAEDESEPADHQVDRAALLPDAQTVVLDGEGHMLPQESPALLAPYIASFLKEQAAVAV